jgi:hypothetical protein
LEHVDESFHEGILPCQLSCQLPLCWEADMTYPLIG